jgi:uncharacterized membrane protein YkoI
LTGSIRDKAPAMPLFFQLLTRSILIVATLAATSPASLGEEAVDPRRDHDLARQGRMQRAILPLKTVLEAVRLSFPGEVAGIELERENGRWLYEIKVISPAGVMREVRVDGRTGVFLRGRIDADIDDRGR